MTEIRDFVKRLLSELLRGIADLDPSKKDFGLEEMQRKLAKKKSELKYREPRLKQLKNKKAWLVLYTKTERDQVQKIEAVAADNSKFASSVPFLCKKLEILTDCDLSMDLVKALENEASSMYQYAAYAEKCRKSGKKDRDQRASEAYGLTLSRVKRDIRELKKEIKTREKQMEQVKQAAAIMDHLFKEV